LGIIYHGTEKTFGFRGHQEFSILEDSEQLYAAITRIHDMDNCIA